MRVLSLRPGHEDEDLQSRRELLASAIADPATTVMIVRGGQPEVAFFADRANGRTRRFAWRELVWVMDPMIFRPGEEVELFDGHADACAVALNFDDFPVAWLEPSASRGEIELAYLQAGKA